MWKKKKRILFFAVLFMVMSCARVFATTFDEQLENCCEPYYEINSKNYKNFNTIKLGRYPQSDMSGKTFEDIEWFCLSKGDGEAFLISKYVLDEHAYSNSSKSKCSWKTSELRRWLNDDFYNVAFNESEKNLIISSLIETDKEEGASCKVFILSDGELWNRLEKGKSLTEATKYAVRNEVERETNESEIDEARMDNLLWWTRQVVKEDNGKYKIKVKKNDSKEYSFVTKNIYNSTIGVRPCIKVKYNGKADIIKQLDDMKDGAIDAVGKAKEITDKLGVTDDIVKEGAKGVAKKYLPGFLGDIAGKVIDGIGK